MSLTRRLKGRRAKVCRTNGLASGGCFGCCSSRATIGTQCRWRFGRGGSFRSGALAFTRFRTQTGTFWTTLFDVSLFLCCPADFYGKSLPEKCKPVPPFAVIFKGSRLTFFEKK